MATTTPTQVQWRRGTTAENAGFTGAPGEVTVDTTLMVVNVHDGAAVGGQPLVGITAAQDIFNKNLYAVGEISPVTNNTQILGNATNGWQTLHVAGNTIYLGNLQLKEVGTNTFAVTTSDGTSPANLNIGNISVTSLVNGTTTIGIPAPNGNAAIAVGGAGNILVASTTGVAVTGNLTVSTDTVITGNLTVNGTTTTINSNVVTTNDKAIVLANNQSTGAAVDGAGIDVGGGTPIATWHYNNATTSWQSNINVTPATNAALDLGVAGNYWRNAYVTTITSTGNVVGGNINTTGLVTATGNVTGGNINTAGLVTATGNIIGGNLTTTGIANLGTIYTNTILYANGNPIIGGTGNLVSGNISSTTVSATGNITGGNLETAGALTLSSGTVNGVAYLNGSKVLTTGTALVFDGTNFTSTGNVTGANINTAGLVTATGNVTAANINTGGHVSATGNVSGLNISAGANLYATSNVNAAGGVFTSLATGSITTGSIINSNANGVGNIGSSSNYFNTVFAKATSAQYADLAEKYLADDVYEIGTVLVIGGSAEVTASDSYNQTTVAGTVSENPATIMNAGLRGTTATVALLGRVPCRVVGKINKGDLLVTSSVRGAATASTDAKIGSVVGKALEAYDDTAVGVIEIMVGRV